MGRIPFYLLLAALFSAAVLARLDHLGLSGRKQTPQGSAPPERIVSLAPSITETLYALGLGERIAGVTDFCAWPPEVSAKPRVAGFSEINREAILRVRPDLVVIPADRSQNRDDLENLGLPTLSLDILSLPGLLQAVATLGERTGNTLEANALLHEINAALEQARARAAGINSAELPNIPKVLFCVMRNSAGSGTITEVHAVGRDGFFNELIATAGGINAYQGSLPFPRLSREAIIFLNPEVIIDVVPPEADPALALEDWRGLEAVSAIKNGRIVVSNNEALTLPGPRFPQTLQLLSELLYPEQGD